MICGLPKFFDGRLVLSCYHGVWEAVRELPVDIRNSFTNDVGDETVSYGGLLQLRESSVLKKLREKNLFACFRAVSEDLLAYVQTCPPRKLYSHIENSLKMVGWDIATGNGWCTASVEGIFPINPLNGEVLDKEKISLLNDYGLFHSRDDCLDYCKLNNENSSADAYWYPVAVYVDQDSFVRLFGYLKKMRQVGSISNNRTRQ